jgi:hypothetical protein
VPSERPSNRKRYLIGSGTACDVFLSDKGVSRSHGCLIVEPDGSQTLIDIGSSTGIAIHRAGQWHRLKEERVEPKDRVRIGNVEVTVSELLVQLQDVRPSRSSTRGKLFISYRRFDTEQATGRIFDFLVGRYGKERIFFDTETIPAAGDFRKHIQTALRESAVLLAVIGPDWCKTPRWHARFRFWFNPPAKLDYVEMEIEAAISEGVAILPILVMGATMPSARRLPPAIRPIVNINAANVRAGRDFQSDMDFIAQTIDRLRSQAYLKRLALSRRTYQTLCGRSFLTC